MIGKSHVGGGFYGCFRYVMGEDEPEKDAHVIGGNLAGRDAKELSCEVRLARQRRSDIEQPVWHVPVAFHPDEHLSDAQMQQACTHFLDTFGVDRQAHQYLIVRHHDTAHGHAHIVVNRISNQGKLLDLHRDWPRVKGATRQVEQELGLRITVEKDEPFREQMRATIERTASSHPRLDHFCGALEAQGITPRLAYRGGVLHGITYRAQGTEVRGSKLGKAYSFPGLQRHLGVEYRPERDEPVIKASYVERGGARADLETRQFLRQRLDQTAEDGLTLSDFCRQLEGQDIVAHFGRRRGQLSKLDYYYQGQRVSGAQLGEAYTLKGLQQQLGIDYRPERDDPVVEEHYLRQAQQRAQGELPGAGLAAAQGRGRQRQAQLPTRRRQRGVELEL